MFFFTGLGSDDDLAVAPLQLFADGNHAVDFSHDGRFGWVPGLEQFGNPWQTTGDVTGLSDSPRDLHQRLAGLDLLSVFHYDTGTDRDVV